MGSEAQLRSTRLDLAPVHGAQLNHFGRGDRDPSWAPDFPQPIDVDAARHLFESGRTHDDDGARFGVWLIVEREAETVIGSIGFDGPPQDGVLHVAYGIVPSRQRKGFAVEALRCLTQYALEQPGVQSIEGHTQSDGSAAVLLKAGYRAAEFTGTSQVYSVKGIDADDPVIQ